MNPRLFAVVALVLLAAVAAAALIGTESPEDGPDTTPEASPSTSTTVARVALTSTTVSSTTTSTAAATTTTAAPPVTISLDLEPVDAEVTVTDGSGTSVTGITPLDVEVRLPVTVTATEPGWNPLEETIDGSRGTDLTLWLDREGQLVRTMTVMQTGRAPKQVAFTPDSRELWVTLLGGGGIEVFDPLTGERLGAVDLPDAGAVEVIFDGDGDRAYASQMETGSVYEIDVESREVLRRLDTESSWTKVMVLSPDETTLYASNWLGNDVSEIDLRSGRLVRKIPVVTTPRGLYVDPSGSRLFVAGYEDGEIEVIDLTTGEGEVIHESGGSMRHLVGDGSRVFASDMARARVMKVDLETLDVTMLAPTDRAPNTIDLSPDGRVLAVSNRGRNNPESYYLPGPEWGSILLIDTATGSYLDAIVGGNQPTGLDLSPDGTLLASSDFLDDRVTVYEIPPTETLLAGDGGRWGAHLEEIRK